MRAILLTAAVLISAAGCSKKSDEELIRAVVDRAIVAANEKKAGGVVADAAEGFKGPQNADVAECRRILVGMFMQQGWIFVVQRSLDVKVEGETAKATLEVLMAKGNEVQKPADLIPTNGDALTFELELAKIAGDWKLTKAAYRRSSG